MGWRLARRRGLRRSRMFVLEEVASHMAGLGQWMSHMQLHLQVAESQHDRTC